MVIFPKKYLWIGYRRVINRVWKVFIVINYWWTATLQVFVRILDLQYRFVNCLLPPRLLIRLKKMRIYSYWHELGVLRGRLLRARSVYKTLPADGFVSVVSLRDAGTDRRHPDVRSSDNSRERQRNYRPLIGRARKCFTVSHNYPRCGLGTHYHMRPSLGANFTRAGYTRT